ncbi:peptide ABC transporter permease [Cohnella sp. CIP 111063]|uniref:ABC transporter permease n=1 Tax=unclassified Cohnella TaxID=2636738 RepID=UPI000B8C2E8B|nr:MULTISPECIES: ABC transporter permease [unclassified Cohnella]OXS62633.1 peptide ABC transporter permease [Cohnella sp. CIP 111063]PRX74893.1 oligopeptide transport system permease protein [Cohnella sp. SGD-V74]
MIRYILKKFGFMLVSLFCLVTATFVLMNAVPGSPLQSEKATSETIQKNLEAYYGLDKPLIVQYGIYLKNLVQGDLGISMKKKFQAVDKIISDSFSYSLKLGLVSVVTSVVAGCVLGIIAAMYHRKFLDNLAMIIAVIGLSIPSLVLAPLLQYVFAVKIKAFEVAGLNGPMDYVLPTIALSATSIAFIARLIRSTMIEVLNADFIKTAKAKGLAGHLIVWRHALRNSMLPVVTFLGFLMANVITGSVVIEKIFAIPGLGKFFVQSVSDRDYPLIMGITIFYAAILMVSRLLADIAYVLVDPRIRMSGGKGAK